MGTHPIFESDFDCLTETNMLACRNTSALLRAPRRILAQPLAASYSNKADITKDNMFWMKHQIEAKPGFHSHINQERGVAAMIGDYVPLIAPVAVAKLLQSLWLIFSVIMAVVFTNFNLKVGDECGVGHTLRALMAM